MALAMTTLAVNAGMTVLGPVGTAADAEALLLSHTPDAAVVDLDLRGELAYGLIDRLHALAIPIVIASAYAKGMAENVKVAAVLHKPFNADILLTQLRRILSSRTTI